MLNLFRYYQPLSRLARERKKILAEHSNLPESLQALLSDPLPRSDTPLNELEYLALDLETSGLTPGDNHILSLGYLEIRDMALCLSSAEHTLVCAHDKVKAETAVINHIVPEMLVDADPIDSAMNALFERMRGKVMIAHGSCIERGFIQCYLQRRYQLTSLPVIWFDTLLMDKSLVSNQQRQENGDYRLSSVRERHDLPAYSSHSALIDALAAGELFMALYKRIYATKVVTLAQYYRGNNVPMKL